MSRFAAPPQRVAHERVEDEVIAINLSSGAYFSLRGTSADVWSLLMDGADVDMVAAILAAHHGVDAADVNADVSSFVEQLLESGLLVDEARDPAADVVLRDPAEAYAAPTVEKFDDMEELLLLDPIHEVDDAGWPVIPAEPR